MRKILILGLDATDFNFIKYYVKKNKLPTFKKLINSGVFSKLKSTIPCNTIPALPTIYTGKNPGNTGVFDFFDDEGKLISTSNIEYKTIWQYLTEKKKRIIISNLNFTYPAEKINGIMICNLHDKLLKAWVEAFKGKNHSSWVYPSNLQSKLNGWTISNERFRNEIVYTLLKGDRNGFENLKRLTMLRFSKFKELYSKDDFDFGFHWINGTDTISHYSWMNKKQILKFFNECIEPILEECIEEFNDHNIILVSDHGSCTQITHTVSLNYFLKTRGYLRMKNTFFSEIFPYLNTVMDSLPIAFTKLAVYLFKALKRNTESKRNLKNNSITFERLGRGIYGANYANSIAYSDIRWGIKLNKNVDNYEKVRNNLIKVLKELKDTNGNDIFQNVWKREEIFEGKYLEKFPDIVILPKQNYMTDIRLKNKFIMKIKNPSLIGKHHWSRNGIFIAYGPDFKENFRSEPYQLVDLMPTIIFLLHLKVPKELDGRVLKEIISEDSKLYDQQIEFSNENMQRTQKIRELTKSEEESIKVRLKALGYI